MNCNSLKSKRQKVCEFPDPLTDDEIISNVLGNEDEEEEEEEEEERNTTPVINAKSGLKYISEIRRFFEQNVVPDEVFNAIHMIESNLENCMNKSKKQKQITDFF